MEKFEGHTDRVGGILWYPGATIPGSAVSEEALTLASSGGEGNIHLWNPKQDTPMSTLSGHTGPVCRIGFHPSGKHLASASFDTTWRLWHVATTTELLLQEGHSREVYTLSLDGSLLARTGLDSISRIYDLRIGRTVIILDGHIKDIYELDWSYDRHRILPGAGDGWVKSWDVRMVRQIAHVGAHKGNVSDVRWFKDEDCTLPLERDEKGDVKSKKSGTLFVSSAFDNWALAKTLGGDSGNVLSCGVTRDARYVWYIDLANEILLPFYYESLSRS